MREWLKGLFSESGSVSAMRFILIFTVVCYIPVFSYQYAALASRGSVLPDIPSGTLNFLTILLGGKVLQKAVEVAGQYFGKKEDNQ